MSREWPVWISGWEAAICGGCGGVFSSRDGGCPKACSGDGGWAPVSHSKTATEFKRLREDLELARGALLTICHGTGNLETKKRLARRALVTLSTRAWAVNEKAGLAQPAKGESDDQTRV
jgi:hypothetical protein